LAAAEAVCGEPLALDYLAQLHECSLIQTSDSGSSRADEIRFRMMESLREYAAEKLEGQGAILTRERHLKRYTELAVHLSAQFKGPGQADALDRVTDEYANISAALSFCLESGRAGEGIELANAVGHFWTVRGQF